MSRQSSSRSSIGSLSSLRSSSDGSVIHDEKPLQKDEGVQMEASSKGTVKGSIPGNYFSAGAHWSVLLIIGIGFIIVQVLASAADYWVSIW